MYNPLNILVITQPFGARPEYYAQFGLKGHEGVDFKTKGIGGSFWNNLMGYQLALAVRDGICTAHYGHPYYGTYVELIDNEGNLFKYCHLKNARPPSPESTIPSKDLMYRVRAGEVLGITGNSGNSIGAHLHLMFRPKNFDINNGYFGYEDLIKLFNQSTSIRIARIGVNLPLASELQVQVDHFTKGKLKIECKDYDVPLYSLGMFTQDNAYNLLDTYPVDEKFVQIYYSSPDAPFLATYSFPNKKKFISTLPNNPPAKLIAFELSHALQFYCNDVLNAHIQIEDSNFPDDAFIQRKYNSVDMYLNQIT